jgi:hypothetical protein
MSTQRPNVGSMIAGGLLVGLGVLALLGELLRGLNLGGMIWPLIVIGCGVLFFVGMLLGGKSVAGLAIPGSIITVNGLMLFYQNLTRQWETWSYGWTLIIVSVGLGIYIMGAWQGVAHRRQAGWKVMKVGAVLFVIFGALNALVSRQVGVSQYLFPVGLILLGLYLVVKRSGFLPERRSETVSQSDDPLQGQ